MEEVSFDKPYLGDEAGMVTSSTSESAAALGTYTPLPPWPWAGRGPYNLYTPYNTQSPGLVNTAWQFASPQFVGWGMPYATPAPTAQQGSLATAGVWSYSSVPNTGYKSH